jgi:hypothetical protein
VWVRTKDEILRTLDKSGQLDGLPFMPEMFAFCGKSFRVYKRAHKTCDPPNGLAGRRMIETVHLEDVRCTGDDHGGCQARCLMFWKDAWLTKDDPTIHVDPAKLHFAGGGNGNGQSKGCTEKEVVAGTRSCSGETDPSGPTYVCQSTCVEQASQPIPSWDLRQYVEDYTSGNVGLIEIGVVGFIFVYSRLASSAIGLGSAFRWVYDTVQRFRGGTLYPWRVGSIPTGTKTPSAKMNLKSGELVRIREYKDILTTLDERNFNRGMVFDAEMVPYCGGTYRVLDRVSKIINEKTGKIQHMKNDCIMLDEVICKACYSKYRRFCPRAIYAYWREIWLEPVGQSSSAPHKTNMHPPSLDA